MTLNISIKDIDPFTASQVIDKVAPLLNNSEIFSFNYQKDYEKNSENYKALLGILLGVAALANANRFNLYSPANCLERTDIYGGTCTPGAGCTP